MNVTIAPRGILQIDDARITYKNFKGEGTKYNRAGDRNFALIIPDKEIADDLKISRSYVSRIEKRAVTKMLTEFIKNKNID